MKTIARIMLLTLFLIVGGVSYSQNSSTRIHPLRFLDQVEYGESFWLWEAERGWDILDAGQSGRSAAWGIRNLQQGQESALMLAGVFDLRNAIDPKATWYDAVQMSRTTAQVQVRVAGARQWETLLTHTPATFESWQQRVVNLQPYVGEQVEFRFVMSRGTGSWFIDDIDVLDWSTDETLPQTVIVCPGAMDGVASGNVRCTLTSTDTESTIRSINALVNGVPAVSSLTMLTDSPPYIAEITLPMLTPTQQPTIIEYFAVDYFGNTEAAQQFTIQFESPTAEPTSISQPPGNRPTIIAIRPTGVPPTQRPPVDRPTQRPPQPEPTETESVTPEPTETESVTPEPTETESVTPEPTETESVTPEPTETESVTPEPTETESATPEPTETPSPTISDLEEALQCITNPGQRNQLAGHAENSRWEQFIENTRKLRDEWLITDQPPLCTPDIRQRLIDWATYFMENNL